MMEGRVSHWSCLCFGTNRSAFIELSFNVVVVVVVVIVVVVVVVVSPVFEFTFTIAVAPFVAAPFVHVSPSNDK